MLYHDLGKVLKPEYFVENQMDAESLHRRLLPLMKALFLESNPGPVKSLLADMGLVANELRLPLVPVEAGTARAVREAARQVGVALKLPQEAAA